LSLQTEKETAIEYLRLATLCIGRDQIIEALRYCREAETRLMQMQLVDVEPAGTVIGETTDYDHLGKVVAEKRRLAGQK
jgi:hypothetical protein